MPGPSELPFLAIVLVLTGVTIVIAAVTWNRPRWRLTRRLVAAFLVQILVLVSLGAIVNANQRFYTTWPGLLGIRDPNSRDQVIVDRPAQEAPSPSASQRPNAAVDRQEAGRSRIIPVVLAGRRTGYRFTGFAYLPGAYFHQSQRTRTFPVVMMLTGYPGSPDTWPQRLDLKAVLDDKIRRGLSPAVVAVMPRQNPQHPRDSECVDAVGGAKAGTYLGEDVPDAVAAQFRTRTDRAGWAVMGYSTGGFCAANLALLHPRRFSKVISLSGYYTPITDASTGDLYRGDATARQANSPLWMVSHRPHEPVSFFLSAAKDHPHDHAGAVTFGRAIRPPDGVTIVVLPTGGHSTMAWRQVTPRAFEWLGSELT